MGCTWYPWRFFKLRHQNPWQIAGIRWRPSCKMYLYLVMLSDLMEPLLWTSKWSLTSQHLHVLDWMKHIKHYNKQIRSSIAVVISDFCFCIYISQPISLIQKSHVSSPSCAAMKRWDVAFAAGESWTATCETWPGHFKTCLATPRYTPED